MLDPVETVALHPTFQPMPSLKFDYFGIDGKPLSDLPGGLPYFRLRYLPPPGFAAQVKMDRKYVQAPKTAPVAYFPRVVPWQQLIGDPDEEIIITEGELKSAKACLEGFPTIGIGGVDSWRSKRLGWELLPSLRLVRWTRRPVVVCFDSDFRTNPLVCRALQLLAEELGRRGALVRIATLPAREDGIKVGLDDFLIAAGRKAGAEFSAILTGAEPLGFTEVLWDLNERYVCSLNPPLVADCETKSRHAPAVFQNYLEAKEQYQEAYLTSKGEISRRSVNAAAAWIRWPLRNEVMGLTYEPGEQPFLENPRRLNLWTGMGVEPKEGDVSPFLELVNHMFQSAEPEAKEWFLQWCAHPIQFLGTKLYTSVVIHGIKQGTGKSLLGLTLGRVYGEANFSQISNGDLHGSFNEWSYCKQFVMGDDVTGGDKRADADRLKKLITQTENRINQKFVPTFAVRDCINYYFTSNGVDAFFLEDDDRRFFIHEAQSDPLPQSFYNDYDDWYKSEEGIAALYWWLLNYELTDFSPTAPAFKTLAKMRMTETVRSDLASWVRALRSTPDAVLRLGDLLLTKDLFSARELLELYDPLGKTGTTAGGLGREMSRAGFKQACEGRPVRTTDGFQARYFAVRNSERWSRASQAEASIHLREWTESLAAKPPKF